MKYLLSTNPSSFPLAIKISFTESESVVSESEYDDKNHSTTRDCPFAVPSFGVELIIMSKVKFQLNLTTAVEGSNSLYHLKSRYIAYPSMSVIPSIYNT